MAKVLVVHGPNLNLLGTREPEQYGHVTLADVDAKLKQLAIEAGHELISFQSNSELALIEQIHRAQELAIAFILINPAGYTHTSVALRDALLAVGIPFFEVHISNIYAREPFRHRSYFSDIAVGVISGFGADSYRYALQAALTQLACS